MATRSVPADAGGDCDWQDRLEAIFRKYQTPPDPRETTTEEAVIRAMGRAAMEEVAANIRKRGLDPRAEGVLFKCEVRIERIFHRYDPK